MKLNQPKLSDALNTLWCLCWTPKLLDCLYLQLDQSGCKASSDLPSSLVDNTSITGMMPCWVLLNKPNFLFIILDFNIAIISLPLSASHIYTGHGKDILMKLYLTIELLTHFCQGSEHIDGDPLI